MATITLTRGKTLPDEGYKSDLHDLVDLTTAAISNIVNADVSATAAIAGTKISPAFGAQDISTSGDCDFDGDVDIDGTLETDAITLGGVAVDTAGGLGTYSTLVLSSIKDYGSSASASTAKNQNALKIAYGTISIGSASSQAITNLPFTSNTSYVVVTGTDNTAGEVNQNPEVARNSGSQFTLYNEKSDTVVYHWYAIGT